MNSESNNKCTLCADETDDFAVTGVKIIDDQEATYQLCASCCQELHGLSFYSPAESKKRREFWNKVWEQLDIQVAAA